MIQELIYNDKPSPDGGRFNTVPPNLKKITVAEFAKSRFFTESPKQIEFRQIFSPECCELRIYWFDIEPNKASGIAISSDYWKGTVEYYKVGCDHNFVEITQARCIKEGITHFGQCWHVEECLKCKHIRHYDSSD